MAGISASNLYDSNKYTPPLLDGANQGARGGGAAEGASDLADAVAKETFEKTMEGRRKAGLYAAAKEIRA